MARRKGSVDLKPRKKKVGPVLMLRPPDNAQTRAKGKAKLHDAKAITTIEERYQAIKLRQMGHSVHDISNAMNIPPERVRKLIVEALNFTIKETSETAEEARQIQVDRLDMLIRQYMMVAAPGDGKVGNMNAAAMVLAIEGRRAKLLALDVPEQKQLKVTAIREYVGINPDDV